MCPEVGVLRRCVPYQAGNNSGVAGVKVVRRVIVVLVHGVSSGVCNGPHTVLRFGPASAKT